MVYKLTVMKKILLLLVFIASATLSYGQAFRDSTKWKVANGDTIWTGLATGLKTYINAGAGTVTSITLTQPAAGLTITGSGTPITTTGTPTFALANDLAAVEGLSGTGIVRRTGTDTWSAGTTVAVTEGGNGLTTATLGDIRYGSGTNTIAALSGNTTTTKMFLSQTGNGSISAVPAWSAVSKSDVGLGNVENTALSTWAGSTNITTLGTVATGTWNATAIGISKGGTGQTAVGTANQILGTNNAANATEWKTISTGTAGTDFAVVLSGANAIVFNIPDAGASARGLMTTGAQTIPGLKTWSGGTIHTGASTVAAATINGVEASVSATVSTTGSIDGTNNIVYGDATSGAFTTTLPAAATYPNWTFTLEKVDATANLWTISGTFIGGSSQKLIGGQYTVIKVHSNGTNYRIID